jgi:predicted RNase H-like HicB family nuclease
MAKEIEFVVERDAENGGFSASWDAAEGGGIATQGWTLSELESNIIEAVRCHFDDSELPRAVRLHFVEDPVLSPV